MTKSKSTSKKRTVPRRCAVSFGSRLPRRRVVLKIKIGADSRERMIEELNEIAAAIRNGNMWGDCLMGSHSAGYVVHASEDETVTHESYFAALEAMPSANSPDMSHDPITPPSPTAPIPSLALGICSAWTTHDMNKTEEETKGIRGEFIAGPFDGLPAMLNGYYQGLVVVLVCDYSGRYAHVPPGKTQTNESITRGSDAAPNPASKEATPRGQAARRACRGFLRKSRGARKRNISLWKMASIRPSRRSV